MTTIFERFRYQFGSQQKGLDPSVTVALQDNFRNAQGQLKLLDAELTALWASRAGNVTGHAGTAPAGALLCFGQAVSRTTYATLFAVIGTTFGSGDGVTTFNVPDLRGRVWAGLDNMGGSDAGRLSWANTAGTTGGTETHTLTGAQSGVPAHTHPNSFYFQSEAVDAGLAAGWGGIASQRRPSTNNYTMTHGLGGGVTANTAADASSSHNNMQPTILGNYIIWTGERP